MKDQATILLRQSLQLNLPSKYPWLGSIPKRHILHDNKIILIMYLLFVGAFQSIPLTEWEAYMNWLTKRFAVNSNIWIMPTFLHAFLDVGYYGNARAIRKLRWLWTLCLLLNLNCNFAIVGWLAFLYRRRVCNLKCLGNRKVYVGKYTSLLPLNSGPIEHPDIHRVFGNFACPYFPEISNRLLFVAKACAALIAIATTSIWPLVGSM